MPQQIILPGSANADATGAVTITMPAVPQGMTYTGSVSVTNADPGMNWNISVGNLQPLGQTIGTNSLGPFTVISGQQIVLVGKQGTPAKNYTATFSGQEQQSDSAEFSSPGNFPQQVYASDIVAPLLNRYLLNAGSSVNVNVNQALRRMNLMVIQAIGGTTDLVISGTQSTEPYETLITTRPFDIEYFPILPEFDSQLTVTNNGTIPLYVYLSGSSDNPAVEVINSIVDPIPVNVVSGGSATVNASTPTGVVTVSSSNSPQTLVAAPPTGFGYQFNTLYLDTTAFVTTGTFEVIGVTSGKAYCLINVPVPSTIFPPYVIVPFEVTTSEALEIFVGGSGPIEITSSYQEVTL